MPMPSNEVITNQISDLQYLIAAPMVATVKADVYAAQAFVEFIEEYGFEEKLASKTADIGGGDDANSHLGKLKMITFWYSYKQVAIVDGEETTIEKMVSVTLPKLSLIPMPILQVSDAKYNFDIRITGVYDSTAVVNTDGDLMRAAATGKKNKMILPTVKATYTPLVSETNVSSLAPSLVANMRLTVNMRQADVPAGISNLLNVVADSSNSTTRRVEPEPDPTPDSNDCKKIK